jgi:hypothetical protein
MLFLLQLKLVWGMWQYKDLTAGDTSSYFLYAYRWFDNLSVNILWSPLYTAFYGTFLYLSSDVYLDTILHRLIIIFTVTLLVLAVFRRLLTPSLAWLAAAWWVILPINFDTLYEVHLFAVIPMLAAWLLILTQPNRGGRGGAIAILFGAAILVRNELIVAASLFAGICLLWEIRLARENGLAKPLAYLTGYGGPLLLAGLLSLFFYTRSVVKFPELPAASAPKHTLNMCQVYAFGYQQRHPEWKKSPWTDCYELMQRDFGERLLPLNEMLWRNPQTVLTHFWWNISLIPNGLQVLLFNATSGTVNPDYAPVRTGSLTSLLLSGVVGAILLVGLTLLYRERHYWWHSWLESRAVGWLAILAVIAVTLLIIPSQRPRPSYLFSLSIFLMALTGMSLLVIAHRWSVLQRLSDWMHLLMVTVLFLVPSYYPTHPSSRQLFAVYRQLDPFEQIIARSDTVFLKGEYADEVANYLGYGRPQVFTYGILAELPEGTNSLTLLESKGINLVYVDEILAARIPTIDLFEPSFSTALQSRGWQLIAFQNIPGNRWMLWQKMQ